MSNVSFVSCFYDRLFDTRFQGRLNRGTQYAYSLGQMLQMDVPFYCYTDYSNFLTFAPAMFYHGKGKTRFFNFNLEDSPYHEDFERVRQSDPKLYIEGISWRQRCLEIMWGKFDFIMHAAEQVGLDTDEYLYWIDAGLSHDGIISPRYNSSNPAEFPNAAKKYQMTHANDLIFNPAFPNMLRNYTGEGKLLYLMTRGPQHSDPMPLPKIPKKFGGTVIGGLFGGPVKMMYELAAEGAQCCREILEHNALVKEEDILTYILTRRCTNDPEYLNEKAKIFTFETWYHDGWPSYRPEQIGFSDLFKDIGINA
jgi:hypothetical protein